MNPLEGRALDIECYQLKVKFELNSVIFRGLINDKEGKAAALPKFLDMLILSQPELTFISFTKYNGFL